MQPRVPQQGLLQPGGPTRPLLSVLDEIREWSGVAPCLRCTALLACARKIPECVHSPQLSFPSLCQPHSMLLDSIDPHSPPGSFREDDRCELCRGYLQDRFLHRDLSGELLRLVPALGEYDNAQAFKLDLVNFRPMFQPRLSDVRLSPEQSDSFYGAVRVLYRTLSMQVFRAAADAANIRPETVGVDGTPTVTEAFLQIWKPNALMTLTLRFGSQAGRPRKRRRMKGPGASRSAPAEGETEGEAVAVGSQDLLGSGVGVLPAVPPPPAAAAAAVAPTMTSDPGPPLPVPVPVPVPPGMPMSQPLQPPQPPSNPQPQSQPQPQPRSLPPIPLARVIAEVGNDPLYISGRYVKLVRGIPQCPFLGERAKDYETSVEQLISGPLQQTFHFIRSKLASSGREDVDVRMLGEGRPFVVQMFDCKRSQLPPYWILRDDQGGETRVSTLEEFVNATASGMVIVKNLHLTPSRDVLKKVTAMVGKRKLYRCVVKCVTANQTVQVVTDDVIRTLNDTKDLLIVQGTPVRVIHRRAHLKRPRRIFWMRAERIDGRHFILDLHTEGGTYIKEFVVSDFGRTSPSLADAMGMPNLSLDILQLDVMRIETGEESDEAGANQIYQ